MVSIACGPDSVTTRVPATKHCEPGRPQTVPTQVMPGEGRGGALFVVGAGGGRVGREAGERARAGGDAAADRLAEQSIAAQRRDRDEDDDDQIFDGRRAAAQSRPAAVYRAS